MASSKTAQPALNWTIVGQGAIGSLAACRLKLAGYAVNLLLKQPRQLSTHYAGQQLDFSPATAPLNAVLIPVKSYAQIDALTSLQPMLSHKAQLVISHNGMGTIEQMLPLLGPEQGLWFLTTTHGALKQGDNVCHTGQGQSILAPLNKAAFPSRQWVLQAMDIALGPATLADDITPYLWQKLAINAAINPLTAIHNCQNGQLQHRHFQHQLSAVVHEVCLVAAASGVILDESALQQKLRQVIQATAQNYSSMQQDIANGRRSEIDAINGYLMRQAARYGIAVPHNAALFEQVVQLSSQH